MDEHPILVRKMFSLFVPICGRICDAHSVILPGIWSGNYILIEDASLLAVLYFQNGPFRGVQLLFTISLNILLKKY